jgi:hypothetical protein
MTTRELISYLQKKASQFTPAELLFLTDQVQKLVLSRPTAQRTVIDEATGMPPYLVTTNNRFTYDCPEDCLRTTAVFAQELRYYSRVAFDGVFRSYTFRGVDYRSLPIKSTDARYGVRATVTFVGFNPGDNTNRYFHEYLYRPPDLTSLNVQLTVPEKFAFDIADGVLARIRSEKFGDKSEWEYWKKNTLTEMWGEMSQGAQVYRGSTPIRPEYQSYHDAYYGNYYS